MQGLVSERGTEVSIPKVLFVVLPTWTRNGCRSTASGADLEMHLPHFTDCYRSWRSLDERVHIMARS